MTRWSRCERGGSRKRRESWRWFRRTRRCWCIMIRQRRITRGRPRQWNGRPAAVPVPERPGGGCSGSRCATEAASGKIWKKRRLWPASLRKTWFGSTAAEITGCTCWGFCRASPIWAAWIRPSRCPENRRPAPGFPPVPWESAAARREFTLPNLPAAGSCREIFYTQSVSSRFHSASFPCPAVEGGRRAAFSPDMFFFRSSKKYYIMWLRF